MSEVEYHRLFSHPGILEVIDYDLRGKNDSLGNSMTEVLILLPYHHVTCNMEFFRHRVAIIRTNAA